LTYKKTRLKIQSIFDLDIPLLHPPQLDIDKDEPFKPQDNEMSGEKLLTTDYLATKTGPIRHKKKVYTVKPVLKATSV
jgi:hypothetical protein